MNQAESILHFVKSVLQNMPSDWLNLTTHRLDIYDESLAKTEFLDKLEDLFQNNNQLSSTLVNLPTAYDYIRLGHPLSCVLEWAVAKIQNLNPNQVISFSSVTAPLLAILRSNSLAQKKTRILYQGALPEVLNEEALTSIYGFNFSLEQWEEGKAPTAFEGSTIVLKSDHRFGTGDTQMGVDFTVNVYEGLGSIVNIIGESNQAYIGQIQHFRRRETIAMTPANCHIALESLVNQSPLPHPRFIRPEDKNKVVQLVQEITGSPTPVLVGSSGLSIQYAIMMGAVHEAKEKYPAKDIKIIVPPNCYGGTNDQARRVAASIPNVEVMDLPVDGGNDMVRSVDQVLTAIAEKDAVPYIIAEIPTNPRVEVPDLEQLKAVLSEVRTTPSGDTAVAPVFILDQTFCPNVPFLGTGAILSTVQTISYVSGSKFPSGGKCTAGYCVGNTLTLPLMGKIKLHLQIADNEATPLQYEILARQLPSMLQRIEGAYTNTRAFVNFIQETLPQAKINFVSEELAAQGFTPSVFSLDLPTKGATEQEREMYKRELNDRLIQLMITQIPNESKYCVSYGQLKGCYWTIPATSTQGTTKEGDKDYIARVALSQDMDLEKHKAVFLDFVRSIAH